MTEGYWDLYGFVSASKYREKIIESLEKTNLTPSQIADSTNLRQPHISSALSELEKKNLVECLNPDRRKGRVYSLTEKGEWVADKLGKK